MPRIDRISALHDDLLLNILSQVPTKDAVTTMVLSKRWCLVWTMVPKLEYDDTSKEGRKSLWRLVDKFLQLHKAPVLECLRIQAERQFTDAADVRNALVVDVPSLACFPLLQTLALLKVVFKDESSHVRLLANCPALSYLRVNRYFGDNVKTFIVKVPSLKSFTYTQNDRRASRSLVLDSTGLRHLIIFDYGDLGSIQNMPHLETAYVGHLVRQPNEKFLRSFSSVGSLYLRLMDVACFSAINFPRLMKFKLHLLKPSTAEFVPGYSEYCSLEPLMFFLHNSPILKVLTISYVSRSSLSIKQLVYSKISLLFFLVDFQDVGPDFEDLPLSWNQQSSVPGCLLAHLEIFVWDKFGGIRRQERECVAYIFANSKCLKTATVLPRSVASAPTAPSGQIAQEEAPPIFWDAGINVGDYTTQGTSPLPPEERADNQVMLSDGLANEQLAVECEPNVSLPTHNQNVVGENGDMDSNVANNTVINFATQDVGFEDGGGSSAGSTDVSLVCGRHQVSMPTNMVADENSPVIPDPNRG
uniref:FBD domain-containing protein n=1 Tax=Brassica campestris TaxID=3711 RepID=M4EM18_BRACM